MASWLGFLGAQGQPGGVSVGQARFALWAFSIDFLVGFFGGQKANQEAYWTGGSNLHFWSFQKTVKIDLHFGAHFQWTSWLGFLGAQKANQELYWIGGSKSICALDYLVSFFGAQKAHQEVY